MGPASLVHRASFLLPLPRPLPYALSGVLISWAPEGGTRCPKVGSEMGNCLESQAPRKQHSENKSCYFNYGSCCLLSHHSLFHTFIRNLVINHSVEARSCQSRCLQLSPLSCPGCILLEPLGLEFQAYVERSLEIRLMPPVWLSQRQL